jgi:probable F420-dependent oxidoreductase
MATATTLKFGFMVPRESDFDDDRDPYPRIYEYCARAEDLGFDFCTFTHHRFSAERPFLSSPLVTMAAIAARTTRLELVTTVLVLPLYHPLDVAEAVAQLDHISGGRVVLGVGAGYRRYEADAVGVPFDRRVSRMTESIEILRAAWTRDSISFHGAHFDFDDVTVVPKPHRRPHPPIWIGALEAKPVVRAGRIADGWIAPSLQTIGTLVSRASQYRDAARGAGRTPVICLERDVVVATDREAARAAWMQRNRPLLDYYRHQGASLPDIAEQVGADDGLPALAEGCAVAGTPDDCVRAITHARDVMGCEYLQLMNLGAGPGYGHPGNYVTELAALELFGAHVLPAFR